MLYWSLLDCHELIDSELESHLNGSSTPVFTVVVHLALNKTSSGLGLLVRKTGQHTKDHRKVQEVVELHQLVGDGVTDVLKMHGRAFDQNTNWDDGVKRLAQLLLLFDEKLSAVRQLEGAGDRLHHDVLWLDTKGLKSGLCTLDKVVNDGGVPSGVEDTHSQLRAWG